MTVERPAFGVVVVRDVDHERRRDVVVDEVVADPLGLPGIEARVVPAQPAAEDRFGQELAGNHVIRVAIRPVRQRHRARSGPPDQVDRGANVIRIPPERAVRPAQVDAPRRAEDPTRLLGFGQPLLDGAVRSHLPRRQIAQADTIAKRRVLGNGPADTDLDVVGVRPEHEQIHRIHVCLPRVQDTSATGLIRGAFASDSPTRALAWLPRVARSRLERASTRLPPPAAGRADPQLLELARLHVVDVAGRQHVVGLLPRLIQARVVVDRHLPLAHHFELVAGDDDRGAFGQADAEHLRILLDDRDEIVPAIARVDVLIDRHLAQELERLLMVRLGGHHHVRTRGVAAHQVFALNRRAGGAAADHAAALQDLVELAVRQRVRVRVDDVPLAAAVEPHARWRRAAPWRTPRCRRPSDRRCAASSRASDRA